VYLQCVSVLVEGGHMQFKMQNAKCQQDPVR